MLGAAKLRLKCFQVEVTHYQTDSVVGDVDAFAFIDNGLEVRQEFERLGVRVLVFERLEIVVDFAKAQFEQVFFYQLENRQCYRKQKPCTVSKYVIPDAQTQSEWEAVEKARLKPLVYPKQIRNAFSYKMSVKLWKYLLEKHVKYF